MRRLLELLALAALVAAAAVGLDRLALPAPALFAGLLVGLARALLVRGELTTPAWTATAAQGVIGVVMGVLVQPDTLTTLAGYWLPVTLITVATLLLTLLAGLLLARFTEVDRTTATFGMIAGGASGIVAVSDELGADGRLVATLQYLRVLLIVVLMPLAVVVVFGGSGEQGALADGGEPVPWPLATLAVLGIAVAGAWAARLAHLPAPSLLGPLVLAAGLAAVDVPLTDAVPGVLTAAAFAVVGAQVGLRFTPATVRTLRRVLPAGLALIVALVVASGGLGVLLSALTGLSPLDGYLATTPGGIFVVLAVAAGSGADSTVVLAVQVLRMLVMLLAGPPLARLLRER
ncbi:AbrB family transcriptional regulator [Geodermatophilus sp. DSM 44513]|uniref:AbrB family transcriptional regulator n=1 Tax=Geodermatophilus sp. DSM 44513 TaxID=1528104 RepID=UPI0028F6C0FE|nr:AbrB family transcriptional regulator [Geodermatophilus sp. DSM 44513]WNV74158.1 AbrB family transcriptional regulator [Geodermatophilus sp. DSM 44513]